MSELFILLWSPGCVLVCREYGLHHLLLIIDGSVGVELLRYWAIIYFWLVTAAVIFVSKVVSGVQSSVEVTPQ